MRRLRSMTSLLWVVALALLVVRTSDAHMHLCLDPKDQGSSLHVADVGPECDVGSSATHPDRDVKAVDTALAKKNAEHGDEPALLPVALFWRVPAPRQITLPPLAAQAVLAPQPLHFLPPLRGPPR
jgi:hypothetical protein